MSDYTYPPLYWSLDREDARAVGVEQFADFLESYGAELDLHSVPELAANRSGMSNAIWRYRRHPGELYKYTDLKAALTPEYGINIHRRLLTPNPYMAYRCGVAGMNAHTVYVVNDVVAPIAEPVSPADHDCFYVGPISAVSQAWDNHTSELILMFQKYMYRSGAFMHNDDPITWLNTMLRQDGIMVYVPDGMKLKRPVQIVNVNDSRTPMMSNRLLFVFLGHDAEADVILCDHSVGDTSYLSTQQVNVFQCYGSRLGLYGVEETSAQTTRFSNFSIHQEEGSRLDSNLLTLTCGLSRNTMWVRQVGDNVQTSVSGAVIADAQQHADNYIHIIHGRANCESEMYFKYVMDGASRGAFTGISYVDRNSQINSRQQHQSLVVSEKARVQSRPVLEIYADDVKCSHGSTVGKLDEAALFYMRQRGIPEQEARLLLQHAFVNDVLQRIPLEPLRERISRLAERRFRGDAAHCDGCSIKDYCQ